VIFYSGSHGSNAAMCGTVAAAYNALGATVVGVDYRGFGSSNGDGKYHLDGASITERSIYEDAWAIYRYVVEVLGVESRNIVLYGFSLGGAVASWVAARAVEQGDVPGALMLHSSIRDMTHAAASTLPLPAPLAFVAGALGGVLTGGAYNTASHLKRLAKHAPDMPLHFRSGTKTFGDDLGLDSTKLDKIAKFTNRSVYIGTEGHQIAGNKQAANTEGLGLIK
jgi:alpha-beta hydrolase superfamily lysophospholipase